MNLDLNSDQLSFRDATRAFLTDTISTETLRRQAEHPAPFDRAWWRQAAELGWTAMLAPESVGGGTVSGRPVSDLAIIAQEMGRFSAPGPLLSTSAVLTGLRTADGDHDELLEAIVSGTVIVSWATYKPLGGWEPTRSSLHAAPDGAGYRVSGARDRVELATTADLFLVTALAPDGPIQALVSSDAPGLTLTETWSLDATRRFARLDFDRVLVTEDSIVHRDDAACAAVRRQYDTAAVLAAAEMCGAVGAMFEATREWMADRYTFGRPLASYQALKHRMADNLTWLEASRAVTAGAALALDEEPDLAPEIVSAAKAYVGEKAPSIVQDFVQLHGGLGVTWEHDLHLYLRRIVLDRALYGTPQEHRQRIASIMERTAV